MKTFLLAGLGLGLAACQVSHPRYPIGVYDTASAFRRGQPSLSGTRVNPAFLGSGMVVKGAPAGPDSRVKIGRDSLWGYVTARGLTYRCVGRSTYTIRQVDTLTVYSRHVGKTTMHYCSQGLAGPLVVLHRHPMHQAFAANPAFTSLLEQTKLYRRLTAREPHSAGQRYRVVALYRQSLGLPAYSPH